MSNNGRYIVEFTNEMGFVDISCPKALSTARVWAVARRNEGATKVSIRQITITSKLIETLDD